MQHVLIQKAKSKYGVGKHKQAITVHTKSGKAILQQRTVGSKMEDEKSAHSLGSLRKDALAFSQTVREKVKQDYLERLTSVEKQFEEGFMRYPLLAPEPPKKNEGAGYIWQALKQKAPKVNLYDAKAIFLYTSRLFYKDLNWAYRNDFKLVPLESQRVIKKLADHISIAVKKFKKYKGEEHFYRNIKINKTELDGFLEHYKKSAVIEESQFTSGCLNEESWMFFYPLEDERETKQFVRFIVDKPKNAYDIAPGSINTYRNYDLTELLYDRGQKFKVKEVKKDVLIINSGAHSIDIILEEA